MDPIADMINAMKTAGAAGRDSIVVSYSKIKENIASILKEEGFLKSYEKKTVKGKPSLVMELHVEERIPKIKGLSRVSKPGKRIYKKSSEIRGVKQGYGLLILSTPKGIMTGRDAKKEKLGGEALFTIW